MTSDLSLSDQWILSRLNSVAKEVQAALAEYRFNDIASTLYQFIWHEYCDWYLELSKPALYEEKGSVSRKATQTVLAHVLETALRLLHPIMPFITEEIWQKLPGVPGSIMAAPYPQQDKNLVNAPAEAEMGLVMEAITAIRNLRGEMNVPPASQVEVFLRSADARSVTALERHRQAVMLLARLKELQSNVDAVPAAAAKAVVDKVEIFMPLAGIIDFAEEDRRLAREIEKIGKELAQAQRKMANEDFLAKAPAEVVQKEKERLQSWTEKLTKLKAHQERIKELMG